MANVLTNRTLHVDTTMTQGYQASVSLGAEPRNLRVIGVKLLGGSAVSSCSIKEPLSGDVLVTLQCAAGATDYTPFSEVVSWRDFLATLTGTGAFVEIYTV